MDVYCIIFETGPELHFDFSWRMAYNIIIYLAECTRASQLVKFVIKPNNNIMRTTWFYNADIENHCAIFPLDKTRDYNLIHSFYCSRHDDISVSFKWKIQSAFLVFLFPTPTLKRHPLLVYRLMISSVMYALSTWNP